MSEGPSSQILTCYECLSVVTGALEACPNCGRTRPAAGWQPDPLAGLVIGDTLQLEDRLGEGGMASVYRARRLGALGGFVAVKILNPSLSRTVISRRFEREAQVISQLSNPNVVRVYALDKFKYPVGDQDLYYIAMELVQGVPLSKMIKQASPLSFLWSIDVLRQTARGLDEAHRQGIVHRDLKPSNIMVTQQGRATHVKVLDFGIASITDQEGEQVEKLTQTGLVTGTPDYMAPEQAIGAEKIGPPADMYSLGVVAFQLFAGHLPFQGNTAMEVLTKRVTSTAPALKSVAAPPALPKAIYGMVDKLLQRDPAKRYQCAGELLDDMAIFPTLHTTPDFIPDEQLLKDYSDLGVATKHGQDTATKEQLRIQGKSGAERPWSLIVAALLVLAGTITATLLLLGDDPTPQKPSADTNSGNLGGILTEDIGPEKAEDATGVQGPDLGPPASGLTGERDARALVGDLHTPTKDAGLAAVAHPRDASSANRRAVTDTSPESVAKTPDTLSKGQVAPEVVSQPTAADALSPNIKTPDTPSVAKKDLSEPPDTGPTVASLEVDLKARLEYPRPPLEPTYRAGATIRSGARDHVIGLPKTPTAANKRISLRLGVARETSALRLESVKALVIDGEGRQVEASEGRVRPQDGRAVVRIAPLAAQRPYTIRLNYTLRGGTPGSVSFQYDPRSGRVLSP